jgi:hypothetical protein
MRTFGVVLAGAVLAVVIPVGPRQAVAQTVLKPLLIEHGFDVGMAASVRANAAQIDALPFDGITVVPANNPCSAKPVTMAAARLDLAAMPRLNKVTHNFLLCRFLDDFVPGGSTTSAFDVYDDNTWRIVAMNVARYARAARDTGMFDGIMIDTEYYGVGPNPWDNDTIPIPWTYSFSRPWTLPAQDRLRAQLRGKQMMDAMRRGWANVVAFHLKGAEQSDPATFLNTNMMGNDTAWANELAGPFFVGAVESAAGTPATVVDGGESYRQRTPADFQKGYSWLKTRLADSGGPILPSGPVTADIYKATVSVANQVYDRDMNNTYAPLSAATLRRLLTFAKRSTDKYVWLYSEQFDWKGTGWPQTKAPDAFLTAVSRAQASP